MKIKNVFGLFLLCTMLVTSIGVFPSSAHTTASPMLEKGPQAIPAKVASSTSPSYGLFECQVGVYGDDFVCYDPYQMRHAYGIDKLINEGFDGKDTTIVIIDAYQSPNIKGQLNTFINFYGLAGMNGLGGKNDPNLGKFTQVAPNGLTKFDPTDENMIGWAEEISLDVEWAHAIAPRANITLVLAKSNQDEDILKATKYAVDHKLGDVISMSFGEDERCMNGALLAKQHALFAKAAQKHITLFASSGDYGAAQPTCDGISFQKGVSSPASDPLVTAVGGTELHAASYCVPALTGCDPNTSPLPGTYHYEIVWNEFNQIASGGGYSVEYKKPSFQSAKVSGKQRGVPDVSYNAAVYHGVLTYIDIPGVAADWYLFGGTSAGSPQWAAISAIADQKAGYNLGYINPALYKIGNNKKSYAAAFFDVTSGNNTVIENVTVIGYDAKKGWDATTGLGSPKAEKIADLLKANVKPSDGMVELTDLIPQLFENLAQSGHVTPH